MLKRILFVLAVAAVSASAALIQGASAQARSGAHATTTTCPPGSSSSAYCEPHCVVPQLQGDTIKQAIAAIKSADCSLGLIYPSKGSSSAKFLTVVAQLPAAGTMRPAHWPVSIGIEL